MISEPVVLFDYSLRGEQSHFAPWSNRSSSLPFVENPSTLADMSKTATTTLFVVAIVAAITLVGTLFWFKGEHLETQLLAPPGEAHSAPQLASPVSLSAARPSEDERVEELEKRLGAESRARERAEEDVAALRASAAPLQGKVVVSLGTVEDIGKRTGLTLPALREMRALLTRDRSTLSVEEKRRLLDLQRQHADVLGMLPEIAGFQDRPAEYGSFFRNMVQQAAGLTDPQASEVETYMSQRATTLNQLGLNSSSKPADPTAQDQWEERRDEFNVQSATGLRALLPPGAADKAGISPQLMELLEMDFDKASGMSP